MADISSPDFETRIAILETKCKERNYELMPRLCVLSPQSFSPTSVSWGAQQSYCLSPVQNLTQLGQCKTLLSSSAHHKPKKCHPKTWSSKPYLHFMTYPLDLVGKCRENDLPIPAKSLCTYEEFSHHFPPLDTSLVAATIPLPCMQTIKYEPTKNNQNYDKTLTWLNREFIIRRLRLKIARIITNHGIYGLCESSWLLVIGNWCWQFSTTTNN